MTTTTESKTQARFRVKGINDERDFCECCGKTGLAKVIWIEDTETSEIRHFGVVCALKPAKGFGIEKSEVAKAKSTWEKKLVRVYAVARNQYKLEGGKWESDGTPLHLGGSLIPCDRAAYDRCIESAKAKLA